MKDPTLMQTVVVEKTMKLAEVHRILLAHLLAVARQQLHQDARKAPHPKVSGARPQGLRPSDWCVILVESDIKKDLHGIVP